MGGKALKEIETRRISKSEYETLIPQLIVELRQVLPLVKISDIPSYAAKKDFGDVDILVESNNLSSNWVETVKQHFTPKQLVKNGEVLSFEHKNFQIDLITAPKQEFDFSYGYFSYNDLGNLVGRVAHKMGFKFSHNGLRYIMRDDSNDSHIISDIVMSQDFYEALEFCGFSSARHKEGFENLVDIFQYVKDSSYFDIKCFLLETRNYRDRVRDQKRKTYMEFLNHLEILQSNGTVLHEQIFDKGEFFHKAIDTFPQFKQEYQAGLVKLEESKLIKSKFNSTIVNTLTGAENKALGEIIREVSLHFPTKQELREFMLHSTQEEINDLILQKDNFLKKKPKSVV